MNERMKKTMKMMIMGGNDLEERRRGEGGGKGGGKGGEKIVWGYTKKL